MSRLRWCLALFVGVTAIALAGPAAAAPPPGPVVLVGIPGLRAADLSPTATPALWRLLDTGAAGSLSVRAIRRTTCPADGWLTVNAAARAGTPDGSGCPFPSVVPTGDGGARVDGFAAIAGAHQDYDAVFGTLAASAKRIGCVAAVGPGAALALADAEGRVERYTTEPTDLSCPLTVVDLDSSTPAQADDRLTRLLSTLPPGGTVIVAGLADRDDTPRLHVTIVAGPRFGEGRLDSASTRQPGLIQLTDLTPTVLDLIGAAPTTPIVGSVARAVADPDAIDRLRGQATAADVQRDALVPFFALLGIAVLALTVAAVTMRRANLRPVAVALGCVPAATFLANVCPWWTFPRPALALAGLVAVAAAVLWVAATFGPWRAHPWGAPGFVALATAGLLAVDAITGSRLQTCALYGHTPLIAGRFYGFGNSTFAVFAMAALLGAAALATPRRNPGRRPPPRSEDAILTDNPGRTEDRHQPTDRGRVAGATGRVRSGLVVAVLGLGAVAVDGWPGWGADVGGVLALVPAFALLALRVSGVRVTVRRAAVAMASGVAILAAVAVVDWLRPATSRSHLGGFVQQVLDGRAGAVLVRKVSAMLHSFVDAPLALLVPVALALVGLWLARPTGRLAGAARRLPTLRPGLAACLVAATVGLAVNDSGATVPAMAMTLAVPLTIALLTGTSRAAASAPPVPGPRADTAHPGATAPPGRGR